MDVTDEPNDLGDPEDPHASIGAEPETDEAPLPSADQGSWEALPADRGGWETTAKALNIMYVSNIGFILITVLVGVIAVIGSRLGPTAETTVGTVVSIAGLILIGFGLGILFAGLRMLWVPKASGARRKAIGVAGCMGLALIMGVVRLVVFGDVAGAEEQAAAQGAMLLVKSIGDLANIAAAVFMVLLLKTVAAHLGETELRENASALLKLVAGFVIVVLVVSVPAVMLSEVRSQVSPLLLIGALAVAVVGLVVGMVKYLRLLRGVRDAIGLKLEAT